MKEKPKIGIITHHYIKNYGAFLQAYALQETISSMYPDSSVEIINYVNKRHYFRNLRPLLISKPHSRSISKAVRIFIQEKRKLLDFTRSLKYLNLSRRLNSADDINNQRYDAIFIGSDEVWSLDSVSLDKIKFAVGLECNNIISYAPSVGKLNKVSTIPSFVEQGIKNFDHISVRDLQTRHLAEKYYNGRIELVLDPTFLYDFKQESISAELYQRDPYILVYQCNMPGEQIDQLTAFANKQGLTIVGAGYNEDWFDKAVISMTPFDWIRLFYEAQCVVTGTFHGTIFAIKAKKRFVALPTLPNRVEKVQYLLDLLGLGQHLFNIKNKENIADYLLWDIDYLAVDRCIEEMKLKSLNFIRHSLQSLNGSTSSPRKLR